MTCAHEPCAQKALPDAPLCYYHDKMERDLLQPVDSYCTPVEIETLFRGRIRHDGRRLDAWTR